MSDNSTATITTIQGLLTFNGSARPVTVDIAPSDLTEAAAAPDLYAALEAMDRAFVQVLDDASRAPEFAAVKAARAALAKARGEA